MITTCQGLMDNIYIYYKYLKVFTSKLLQSMKLIVNIVISITFLNMNYIGLINKIPTHSIFWPWLQYRFPHIELRDLDRSAAGLGRSQEPRQQQPAALSPESGCAVPQPVASCR